MLIDCHNHPGVDLFFYRNGFHPSAQDLPALRTGQLGGGEAVPHAEEVACVQALPAGLHQAVGHDNLPTSSN